MNEILSMPVVDILRIGLSGLCFLLACLAYRLIAREQDRHQGPRKGILRAIYAFMACNALASLLCAASGYLGGQPVNDDSGIAAGYVYQVDYSNFYVDLTSWKPDGSGKVVVIRTDLIRKLSSKNEDYVIPYFTTGDSITCEPLNYSTRPVFERKERPELQGVHYDYRLAVGHQPAGYTEQISSRFTFPNGFKNPNKEWWQAGVWYPAKTVAVTMRFPDEKPCNSNVASTIDSLKKAEPIRDNPPSVTQEGRVVSWIGLDQRGSSRIQFDWSW